jgi:hypothetical protein
MTWHDHIELYFALFGGRAAMDAILPSDNKKATKLQSPGENPGNPVLFVALKTISINGSTPAPLHASR